jgi:hypothetical protein
MRAKQFLNEDWQKVNKKDKTDGMSDKAVKAYRRENPGSKLKTAVTKKPSELKAGSKDANRRKSFCARMSGNKGPMKDEKGRPTPKAKALARWNCESIEQLEQALAEAALGVKPKRPAREGSRPERGHTPQSRYGISKDKETQFHAKLDNLVHDTFGKRDDEIEEIAGAFPSPSTREKWAKDAAASNAAKATKNDIKKQHHMKMASDLRGQLKTSDDKDLAEHKKGVVAKKYTKKPVDHSEKQKKATDKATEKLKPIKPMEGKASRELCKSSKPDSELGASNLASCKSQGLRARDGEKSHKLGKSPDSRVKVGGHRIKGRKYGGPLPDWS